MNLSRFCYYIQAIALTAALIVNLAGCTNERTQPQVSPTESPKPPLPFQMEDVTASSGIQYHWTIAGSRPLNILQTIGNGCALLDYDNDDRLDVLLVGPRLALFKGDGHGRFTDVTVAMGLDKINGHFLGCTVGDYDNDGYEDIYITGYRTGVLLHNDHGKRFTDVTREAGIAPQPWGSSASFVELDRSGRLDLVIGNYVAFGPGTKPQLCNFGGIRAACGPKEYTPEFATIYKNLDGKHFRDITQAYRLGSSGKDLGVACADYRGDLHPSIALANDEMPGDLFDFNGKTLSNVGPGAGIALDTDGHAHAGMGIDWGDYDNDGKLDMVVATFEHEPKNLYHNDGGVFTDRSTVLGITEKTLQYVAFGVKFVDLDNDGWLDLVFTNGHVEDNVADFDKNSTYRQPTVFLHNEAGARFTEVDGPAGSPSATPIVGRGLAVGDFDNDGREDLLLVDAEGTPHLLHNVSVNQNHWLRVVLHGTRSNRDGIGAMVTVQIGNKKLLRRCAADGSYLSASDKRLHFGLGTEAGRAVVTVKWPSGQIETYRGVPTNEEFIVTETQPWKPH